jgi:hypothetical protein
MRERDMTDGNAGGAVSDAQLVSYMHDALDADTRAMVQAEIASSRAAAERLRMLRAREARFGAMLKLLDPDELSTRRSAATTRSIMWTHMHAQRRTALVRAAAVVLILGAAALTFDPVRATAAGGLRSVAVALGLRAADTAPRPTGDMPSMVRTTFVWTGPVFTVALPPQAAVHISVEPGADGRATVIHESGVAVVVGGDGVRIEEATAPLSLHIELPTGVTTLRIRQDGRVRDHPLSGVRHEIVVTPGV